MSEFTDAVERNLEGLHVAPGACPGCEECGLEDVEDMNDPRYDLAGEPSFSWSACESCGSRLGGDRHPAHALTDGGEIIHFDICVDCLFFLANGDEPDPEVWR